MHQSYLLRALVSFLLLSFSLSSFATANPALKGWDNPELRVKELTQEQIALLTLAYHVGKATGMPETLQAILMQETLAGKLGRVDPHQVSFGVTQVKPVTAMDMVNRYLRTKGSFKKVNLIGYRFSAKKTLSEYKKALLNDDLYALMVAAITITDLLERTPTWRQAVVAYNTGVAGSFRLSKHGLNNHAYLLGVKQKLKTIRLFNKKMGLK